MHSHLAEDTQVRLVWVSAQVKQERAHLKGHRDTELIKWKFPFSRSLRSREVGGKEIRSSGGTG